MNQLSLFADLLPASTPVPVVLEEGSFLKEGSVSKGGSNSSANDLDRTSELDQTSKTAEAREPDTLLKLAALIREGRDQLEAQSRRRSRPVQAIGDLAQSVLHRHDLVASRRSANQKQLAANRKQLAADQNNSESQVVSRSESKAGFADTPTEVHVAS